MTPPTRQQRHFSRRELVAYLAAMMAPSAFAIDITLPAQGVIGADLAIKHPNDAQLVVFVFLVAFGAAQLFLGPLSDRFGRRAVAIGALTMFCVASIAAAIAPTFELLLAARAVQGMSAAAARVATTAMTRDMFSGSKMAEVISVATTVFMAAPILAPGVGQIILLAGSWRLMFAFLFAFGFALLVWTLLRAPETLPIDKRRRISLPSAFAAYREYATTRASIGYTIAAAFVFGAFFNYLGTAQQIYVGQFGLGPLFPIAFAAGAVPYAFATLFNARLVGRLGMRRISHAALIGVVAVNVLHFIVAAAGIESVATFIFFMCLTMFALGLIGSNSASIALEPMGHIAGSAAALNGFIGSTAAAIIGAGLGQLYDGTTLPLAGGFAGLGAVALASAWWAEYGRLFKERTGVARSIE